VVVGHRGEVGEAGRGRGAAVDAAVEGALLVVEVVDPPAGRAPDSREGERCSHRNRWQRQVDALVGRATHHDSGPLIDAGTPPTDCLP